ncbi:peptidoglycan-associated lipoprotein Pal [Maricaulis sp.]|uniref:peptidoglycan-associated lipoprotein Pal n=1 Tax=unclassified Maricaulis TaxID=2632371 RepID=UPI001B2020B0|nr:peptidoglycan-associated lipoprotein Pal [Maricaulis sp.]MBO6796564.1 peptidoglycan-associated lipoprotein Pal [Maricaulis sp.]
MKIKLFAIAALAAFATACASTPEPVADPIPEPQPTRPAEPAQPTGPTAGSVDHFVQTAGDRVFFGYDRHDLSSEARAVLRDQAAWLMTYSDARITIAGNCDERGTREYNLALGARRANAARDYLISQGVDPSRITTTSFGKERPICRQSNEQCWATNRNAITEITSGYTN